MAQGDSTRRLNDWFVQWRRPLRQFLARRRAIPTKDIDDVTQEVFLRLLRYQRAELVEQPQAYLYKVASNVASEWAIRARNAGTRETVWLADSATDPVKGELDRLEIEEEIETALLSLPIREREVLKLQFFEGLSHAQIADRLGISERIVKRVLAKSYQRLRQELMPRSYRGP